MEEERLGVRDPIVAWMWLLLYVSSVFILSFDYLFPAFMSF